MNAIAGVAQPASVDDILSSIAPWSWDAHCMAGLHCVAIPPIIFNKLLSRIEKSIVIKRRERQLDL